MSLNDDLNEFLDPILRVFSQTLRAKLMGRAATTYLRGSAQMVEWGRTITTDKPIFFEGPPMQEAIDYANKRAAQLVTKMNQETKERLAKVVGDAIENKRGIPGLARDIRKEFDDMTKYRSELIAKSETRDSLFHAAQDRMEDLDITGKEWILGSGGKEGNCPDCLANARAGVIPVDDEFPTPQYDIHPGCLLPDSIVEASGVVAATRAFYSGYAVKIITENGHRLAITPNHMILTKSGFVKAKSLHKGDNVVSSLDSEGILRSMNPNNHYRPARITDIWNSLVLKQGMMRRSMPVASHDFYGDASAFNGNVDIVYSDSLLLSDILNPFSPEHISEDKFYGTGADKGFLYCPSPHFPFGNGGMSTPSSNMSMSSNGVALLDRHSGHPQAYGLAHGSRGDTRFDKVMTKHSPAYTKLASKFLLRFPSQVTLDQIVEMRDFYFSGHVYDLQSLDRLYISNHIIVKNCTCSIAPALLRKK